MALKVFQKFVSYTFFSFKIYVHPLVINMVENLTINNNCLVQFSRFILKKSRNISVVRFCKIKI